jgi:hypothetical protein
VDGRRNQNQSLAFCATLSSEIQPMLGPTCDAVTSSTQDDVRAEHSTVGAAVRLHAAGATPSLEHIQCISWHGCQAANLSSPGWRQRGFEPRQMGLHGAAGRSQWRPRLLLLARMGDSTRRCIPRWLERCMCTDTVVQLSYCNHLFQTRRRQQGRKPASSASI